MLLAKYKWVIGVGIMLWCIVVFLGFNIVVSWQVFKLAFVRGDATYISLPALLVLMYIAISRTTKPSPRVQLALKLSLVALFFALTWFRAMEWGVISHDYLLGVFWFTAVFSTGFTAVFVPVSLKIYRSRRKTANEYIAEVARNK